MTSRRRRCRPSARGSNASRAFSAMPAATHLPRSCSAISTRCSGITRGCSRKRPAADRPALQFPPDADDHKTLDRLARARLPRAAGSLRASSAIGWPASIARCKGEAARDASCRSCCRCCSSNLARTDNPDAALVLFDHFLANLHGAARLLSLLRQNPELIALIALVLGIAPRLADTLARYPQVMDALVDPSFFGALPDDAELGAAARSGAGAVALRRGSARAHPHVRAGIHVPDRRAHPVRHGDGAAGGRGLRAARRRGDPRRASRGRRQFCARPTAICAARKPRCSPWASSAATR